MKNKILTAISTIMLFIPWTILPLRTFDWALESPVAEIMIYSYAAFMIFRYLFNPCLYKRKSKIKTYAALRCNQQHLCCRCNRNYWYEHCYKN